MNSFVIDESYINNIIDTQKSAIKYYFIFGTSIFTIGLIVIFIAFILPKETMAEGIKTLLGIGGGFVSSLSGLQVKEIIQRKEKISVFSSIKNQLVIFMNKDPNSNQEEINRLKEIMWKQLEKTALS